MKTSIDGGAPAVRPPKAHRRACRRARRRALSPGRQSNHRVPVRDAVAAVEFAVIASIMFIIIFACIEFARVNMVRNLSQDAAYFGARTAMVPGATAQEAEDEVHRMMRTLAPTGYSVNVNQINRDTQEIRVTVAVDLNQIAWFAPMFFRDQTMTTNATMRAERYNGFYRND